MTSREASSKEQGSAPDDLVEFNDDLWLEVMMTTGQRPDLILEFLDGFWTHTARERGENKPEEGIALAKGSDASFLHIQLQAERGQDLLD